MIFDFDKGFDNEAIAPRSCRPLIAISANVIDENSALHAAYSQAIIAAGGVPLIVPHTCDSAALRAIVEQVDGVLFSGGADFDARYFGAENIEGLTEYNSDRDYHEFTLLRLALDRALPLMGICRGFQLFNIALGGDIYQDLKQEYPREVLPHSVLENKHLGVHEVQITAGSQLHQILQCDTIKVNSRHHQALKRVAPALKVVAVAEDGVIEAVEGYPERKILGVQWHPENMATVGESAPMQRLFEFFTKEARLFSAARELHRKHPIVDSHCDTPMLYAQGGFSLAERNSVAKVDIAKMEEGRLDATITVAYIPQSTSPQRAVEAARETLVRFAQDIASVGDRAVQVRSVEELLAAKAEGRRAVMLGIENGLALGDSLSSLDEFKALGVVYITLCHNGSNAICDSAAGEQPHGGVSAFGREVIARMNELGIVIDVSHSSHAATMAAVEYSRLPLIASHSSCKALLDHRRNLSDEAVKAIAAGGGVVQVCGYAGFLRSEGGATICDIVAHIEHIIALVGYDHVGIGSDFDGDGGVAGFDGANEFVSLTVELLRRGHKACEVAKIMGGNILRVISENQNKG